jgi:hypothetical protein
MPKKRKLSASANNRSASKAGFGSGGDYISEAQLREEARDLFFETIRQECGEVLYHLRDEVFPVYKRCADKRRNTAQTELNKDPHSAYAAAEWNFIAAEEATPDVAEAVRRWAEASKLMGEDGYLCEGNDSSLDPASRHMLQFTRLRAHCEAVWPCQRAMLTLFQWYGNPDKDLMSVDPPKFGKRVTLAGAVGLYEPTLRIEFGVPQWFPKFEREMPFRNRAHAALEKFLDSYTAGLRKESKLLGQKRRAQKERDHFRWAVDFQIRGMSYPKIAGQFNLTEQTIRDGVEGAATLIGLKLRPGSRGPKRKTKNLRA